MTANLIPDIFVHIFYVINYTMGTKLLIRFS